MLAKLAKDGADQAPSWAAPVIEGAVPVIMKIWTLGLTVWPHIMTAFNQIMKVYETLPVDLLMAIWGLLLCFFGGTFPLSIAAYEAFKISGWDQTRTALSDLTQEYKAYRRASVLDDARDKKDDNGKPVPTPSDIDPRDLIKRKASLAFRVCDPEKFQVAVEGIYQGFLGVIATLKFKYARTVALGVSIGSALKKPATMYVTPVVGKLVSPEHQKWIPYGINYACKAFAVMIAWQISNVMSAVQSGIRGGLIFSRSLLRFANEKGWVTLDDEDTYIDEAVGWGLAVLGAGYQIMNRFNLPFPLNILLIPFRMLEAWLQVRKLGLATRVT